MAIDPVILKKINDDIAAAQGDMAALNAALAMRAAYLAQESQNQSSTTVVESDDNFDIDQPKESKLFSAISGSRRQCSGRQE